MLPSVGGALHQSNIAVSPEFAAASAELPVDQNEGGSLPTDIGAALTSILEVCDGDPFIAAGSLMESGHALPSEARGALASALALAGSPEARGVAVLFLLDPESAVCRAAAGSLGRVATSLTPTDLRRLIAMRNWRPKNERAEVDAIIRKARAAGIVCAQWAAGGIETIVATCIDGATAQGAGWTEMADFIDSDQRWDYGYLERRAGIASPESRRALMAPGW
jgi:hypothetical protein